MTGVDVAVKGLTFLGDVGQAVIAGVAIAATGAFFFSLGLYLTARGLNSGRPWGSESSALSSWSCPFSSLARHPQLGESQPHAPLSDGLRRRLCRLASVSNPTNPHIRSPRADESTLTLCF